MYGRLPVTSPYSLTYCTPTCSRPDIWPGRSWRFRIRPAVDGWLHGTPIDRKYLRGQSHELRAGDLDHGSEFRLGVVCVWCMLRRRERSDTDYLPRRSSIIDWIYEST